MRIIYKIVLILLVSTGCFSQENWINYTNNFYVTDIEEIDGALWLASNGGLCFFDSISKEEIYYNRGNSIIPSNTINDIMALPNNDLWMTTSNGISLFKNGEFNNGPDRLTGILRITPDNKVVVANYDSLYIQTNEMNFEAIAYPGFLAGIGGIEIDEKGTIFINAINYFAETYVARYMNNTWDIIYSDFIYESAIAMDSKNTLWFFNVNGLFYWEDNMWNLASEIDSLDAFNVGSLSVDNDDNILTEINSDCPRVLIWNGVDLNEINFIQGDCEHTEFVKPSNRTKNLYYSSHRRKGLYTFNTTLINDFIPYTQSPIHSNSVLTTLHPTDESNIIVFSNRIQELSGNIWSSIPIPSDLDQTIRFADLRKDTLYISDSETLWFLENDIWKKLPLPNNFNGQIDFMVIGESGTIWIQYGTYIARFITNWEVFGTGQHGISTGIIKDMVIDNENDDLWVSSFQGVRHFDGNSWHNYDFSEVNHTFSLAVSNQGIYVRKAGLFLIRDGEIDTLSMPPIGYYGTFESEMVYDRNKDRLYLSGSNHLAVLENDNWMVHTLDNSGVYNGYSSDLKIDSKGNLWLSGSSGGLEIFNDSGIVLSTKLLEEEVFSSTSIHVFPTLVGQSMIQIKSDKDGIFSLTLFNLEGKIYVKDTIELNPQSILPYPLPNCPTGSYFLVLSNGQESFTTKLVITGY